MKYLSLEDIKHELAGDDDGFLKQQLGYIDKIQQWLEGSNSDGDFRPCYTLPNRLRYASSLTSRAEAQLFSISLPRFCVRLYVDENHHSFINLRRSALLVEKILQRGGWATRQSPPARLIQNITEISEPVDLLEDLPGLVGDSVFAVPQRFRDFKIITTRLHSAYGDYRSDTDEEDDVEATPFVQHYWATGLCGHAVVLMASMLMQEHAVSIHALAEIAAFLRSKFKDEILITGLSPRHIYNYFRDDNVGLQSIYQAVPAHKNGLSAGLRFPDENNPYSRRQCFQNALRSYLLSGFPVIKHVDHLRMRGFGLDYPANSIYRGDQSLDFGQPEKIDIQNHCVLIIGASPSEQGNEFLLHDPGGLPYMQATAEQLMQASTYVSNDMAKNQWNPQLTDRRFQPVTPGRVKMPLHTAELSVPSDDQSELGSSPNHDNPSEKKSAEKTIRLGLFDVAGLFFQDIPQRDDNLFVNVCPTPLEYCRGEFRLVKARNIQQALTDDSWLDTPDLPENLIESIATIEQFLTELDPDHYYWVQRFSNSCWVWNAERQPPISGSDFGFEEVTKHLIAVASPAGPMMSMEITTAGDLVDPPQQTGEAPTTEEITVTLSRTIRPDRELQLSLISSFHNQSTRCAAESWPHSIRFAELYTFMQGDVTELLHQPRGMSAVEAMASLCKDRNEIDRIAREINDLFVTNRQVAGKPTVQIRAFATFVPELLEKADNNDDSEHGKRVRRRASDAVHCFVFLFRLARALRALGHDVSVIEVVGGSVIGGVLPVLYKGRRCLLANRKSPLDPPRILLENLGRVYSTVSEMAESPADARDDTNIRCAIEIEPGPLFAFEGVKEIDALLAGIVAMEPDDLPRGRVGLNADVGHWMLSGISPNKLLAVADRVFNVHLSDHPKAHTGDCVVASINPAAVFREWTTAIKAIPPSPLSAFTSIEMECVKDNILLGRAIVRARSVL